MATTRCVAHEWRSTTADTYRTCPWCGATQRLIDGHWTSVSARARSRDTAAHRVLSQPSLFGPADPAPLCPRAEGGQP